jgi:hypothetical protein
VSVLKKQVAARGNDLINLVLKRGARTEKYHQKEGRAAAVSCLCGARRGGERNLDGIQKQQGRLL